jgi:hypothetical protein
MTAYTIRTLEEVPDAFGCKYPGSMRFLTEHLATSGSPSPTA